MTTYFCLSDPKATTAARWVNKYNIPAENIHVLDTEPQHQNFIQSVSKYIKFNHHLSYETVPDMIDYAVINPPFKGNEHLEHLLIVASKAKNVVCIHPAGWLFRNTKDIERRVKREIGNRVKSLTICNGNTKFTNHEFQTPCVITELGEPHNNGFTLQYDKELSDCYTGEKFHFTSFDDIPRGLWEPSENHLNLVQKYETLTQSSSLFDRRVRKGGNYKYYVSTPNLCGDGRSKDATKLVKDDFFTFFYSVSSLRKRDNSGQVLYCNSADEMTNLISYMSTKIARFGLSINKVSVNLPVSSYWKNVPLPPLDRSWDDNSLCEYYNITQEEFEYINKFIPDFYDEKKLT
jgi:hypothetical protein